MPRPPRDLEKADSNLRKHLEQCRQLIVRNANALVRHGHDNLGIAQCDLDPDLTAGV